MVLIIKASTVDEAMQFAIARGIRGLSLRISNSVFDHIAVDCPDQYRDTAVHWFCEHWSHWFPESIVGVGFPNGTLLYHS